MKKYLNLSNLGWLLLVLVSAALVNSSVGKIFASEEMIANFKFMNLSSFLLPVGVAELLAVGLLLFPKTSSFGALLITSLMSAAAVMHLSAMGGQNVMVPIMIAVVSWCGHCLRRFY